MTEDLTKVKIYVNFEYTLWPAENDKRNFSFVMYGSPGDSNENIPEYKTQILQFLDTVLEDEKIQKKLLSVLEAINSNPMQYCHEEKFKPLEDKVWEIKCKQLRIACIWNPKPKKLVAIYGFMKKTQKWPKKELNNMRLQRDAYLKEMNGIESKENENGRISKV